MKKKVALLLVLSMILSMIPTNVFGQPNWVRQVTQHGDGQSITFEIPVSFFSQMHYENANIEVLLGGGGTNNVNFNARPAGIGHTNADPLLGANTNPIAASSQVSAVLVQPGQSVNIPLRNITGNVRAVPGGGDPANRNMDNYQSRAIQFGFAGWGGASFGTTPGAVGIPAGAAESPYDTGYGFLANVGFGGHVAITITNVRVNHSDANLTVRVGQVVANATGITVPAARTGSLPRQMQFPITSQSLVGATLQNAIQVNYVGDPVDFPEVLHLRPISLNEGNTTNFNNASWIRLEAPNNYRWEFGGVNRFQVPDAYATLTSGGTGRVDLTAQMVREERVAGQLRQVLYIPLNNITLPHPSGASYLMEALSGAGNPFARTIEIRNLVLVPNFLGASGRIDVNVSTGTFVSGIPGSSIVPGTNNNQWESNSADRPFTNVNWTTLGALQVTQNVANDRVPQFRVYHGDFSGGVTNSNRPFHAPSGRGNYHRSVDIHVGNRTGAALEFVATTDIPEARTGYLGYTTGILPGNRRFEGVRTATVELREIVPGTWGTAIGNRIDFEFNQPGVTIVGVRGQAGWNSDVNNIFGEEENFMDLIINPWDMESGHLMIHPNGVTARIDHHVSQVGQNYNQFRDLRRLRVTFYISVEAGFEFKNPGEDIYVTVSGAGVAQLPEEQRSIVVATPVDPISVHLPGGPIDLATDTFRNVANEQISDLEITIYEPHRMIQGSEIWVYVSGDEANRNAGLNLAANLNAVVEGTGLILGPGRWLGHQVGTFNQMGAGGIAFPVVRVPGEHENTNPVTIRIENMRVTGNVVPGIEYFVVVSGSAFAENDQVVFTDHFQDNITIRALNVGVFTSLPYFVSAINYGGGGGFDLPPAEGGPGLGNNWPGQQGTLHPEFQLWAGMPAIAAGEGSPFAWQYTSPQVRVGTVAARLFSDRIGGTADFNEVTRQATITGLHHVTGETVTVVLTVGSATATINGVSHDIATFVNFQSGPAGSVVVIPNADGRIFVPLRFMADAFGMNTSLVNDVVIVN